MHSSDHSHALESGAARRQRPGRVCRCRAASLLTLPAFSACSDVSTGAAGLVGALPLPSQGQGPDEQTPSAVSAEQQSSRQADPSRQPRKGLWAARQRQRQRQRQESTGQGNDFPHTQQFWRGGPFVYLGSGARAGFELSHLMMSGMLSLHPHHMHMAPMHHCSAPLGKGCLLDRHADGKYCCCRRYTLPQAGMV